jgi:hypothetical protein
MKGKQQKTLSDIERSEKLHSSWSEHDLVSQDEGNPNRRLDQNTPLSRGVLILGWLYPA